MCVPMLVTTHVETVCLLCKLDAGQHIETEVKMDEMDLTAAGKKQDECQS